MYLDEGIKKHIEGKHSSARHWRTKGRRYHAYVDTIIQFLVPKGKKVLSIDESFTGFEDTHSYDYIIVSDLLGHAHDVEEFLRSTHEALVRNGRIAIIQYNSLWEPILRFASLLHLRTPSVEQNWLSPHDLRNFLHLAGFEVVHEGNKMLLPVYVPLLSAFFNTLLANIWPFSKLGLIHYVVARPVPSARTDNPSISIIVPARNEAGTIERIVNELPSLGSFTEIIFIEGHSKDNTLEELARVTKQYEGNKRISYAVQDGTGKGDAVRKGFDMATGDILAIYDADMTVPPEYMEKFYRAIANNYGEFINGSRLVYPVEKGAMRILNFFGNKFFSFAFTAILGQPLKDTLCGTKVLWKKDYESIQENRAFFGDFDPFGDFDLLFGAAKLNLKIVEVPIRYKERVYGETNISRWKHGWLLLKMTVFAARKLKFW
ncbi:MAG: glycosyltransferase [Candidatus Kaiserbacteria bacterium]|nr:glycosyltransferase [Candidatus Kaiserbacteria bacterium]